MTKEVKDIYAENYKTLTKDIKVDSKKDIPCSWIEIANVDKIAILLKATYRFNAIGSKFRMTFFTLIIYKYIKTLIMKVLDL